MRGKRRPRPKIALTIPELAAGGGLVLYAIGALGFALFGVAFFLWFLVLAAVASPLVFVSIRRRRRRLERLRAARRRARVAAYAEPWLEWEEAA